MALIDKITVVEEEAMLRYIHWYADANSSLSKETLLQYWNKNKESLAAAFGGDLILSKKITYKKDVDELSEEIDNAIFSYCNRVEFVSQFRQLYSIGGIYEYHPHLHNLMYADVLAKNVYEGESFTLALPNDKSLVVNNGCKVSKVLGKLAAALDLKGYEEFRIIHSQVLNQKQLKGNLCISIHPLDYMTMSDNDCGWDSCMSWTCEGEYRRGTVEMMNSSMVVVAYLTAEDPYSIGSLNWSNKKWRELFVVTPSIITGVKPYPYENEFLEKIVIEWLKELAETNLKWEYFDDMVSYQHRTNFSLKDDIFNVEFYTDSMYNDFGTRNHHIGYVGIQAPHVIYHNYSGESQCMHCGKDSSFDTEQDLVCYDCDDCFRCAECGERQLREYAYTLDGEDYCEYCYDNISQECQICEEHHHTNSCYDLYLAKKNPEDDSRSLILLNACINICDDCYNALKRNTADWIEKYFKPGATLKICTDYWTHYCWFDISECTEEGLKLFGYDSVEDAEFDDYDAVDVSNPI